MLRKNDCLRIRLFDRVSKFSPSFLKEIENERRREFAGEGLRWMDMRRFGSMKAHLESKGVDIRRVHFPVYSGERVNNPKLHQTPYYQ